MARTLLLDRSAWDLVLDANGDIALAAEPYAVAQDAASAIRLFLGELWYDTTKGLPYFQQILGQPLSAPFLKAQIIAAVLAVPTVTGAAVTLTALENRGLSGQVQITYALDVSSPSVGTGVPQNGRALISFVADNGGLVVFVADNGGVLSFYGE